MGKKSRHKRDRRAAEKPPSQRGGAQPTIAADIQKIRERYLAEWRHNATAHEKNGDYAWMSSFLHGYEKVLEIGPGDGKGTLQLTQDGHTVVGVDENPACLSATEALLRSHAVATQMELTCSLQAGPSGMRVILAR